MKLIFILLVIFQNCNKVYESYNSVVSGVEITDEVVLKYTKAVKSLHKLGPNIPQRLAEKDESIQTGKEIYNQIESVIQEAGFKDYAEFVKVNAKVAWAWNVSQGILGIEKFQNQKDLGLKQIEEVLANPEVPEETKIELRKAAEQIQSEWTKNKKYADISMSIVRPLTNEKDLEVIKRNQKILMEAYTGLPQSTLKEIDPNLFLNK